MRSLRRTSAATTAVALGAPKATTHVPPDVSNRWIVVVMLLVVVVVVLISVSRMNTKDIP